MRAIEAPLFMRWRDLNCSQHLGELFAILFGSADNWEVQASALTILDEQVFEFIRAELMTIGTDWDAIKHNWNRLNGIDEKKPHEIDHDQALIQRAVDGYLAYLNEQG